MFQKKKKNPIQAEFQAIRRKWKRKAFRMKAKLFLTAVLPVLMALIGTAAARIFLRMKLRKAASGLKPAVSAASAVKAWPEPESESVTSSEDTCQKTAKAAADIQAEPVSLERTRPEFVKPEAVETAAAVDQTDSLS